MELKIKPVEDQSRSANEIHYGVCMDCHFESELKDFDTDTEPDDFKGIDRKYHVCPKCGGAVETNTTLTQTA